MSSILLIMPKAGKAAYIGSPAEIPVFSLEPGGAYAYLTNHFWLNLSPREPPFLITQKAITMHKYSGTLSHFF